MIELKMSRRVLVTGGRDNYDFILIYRAVRDNLQEGDVLVHGAASGADSICSQAAAYLGFRTEAHPANWKIGGSYNPQAGPQRNQLMCDLGADFALVFSGGKGTKDMEARLALAGIPCRYYPS
jgi:hypothetical protein